MHDIEIELAAQAGRDRRRRKMGERIERWRADDGTEHDTEEAMVEHEADVETRTRADRYATFCGINGDTRPRTRTRLINTIRGYEEWLRAGEPAARETEA